MRLKAVFIFIYWPFTASSALIDLLSILFFFEYKKFTLFWAATEILTLIAEDCYQCTNIFAIKVRKNTKHKWIIGNEKITNHMIVSAWLFQVVSLQLTLSERKNNTLVCGFISYLINGSRVKKVNLWWVFGTKLALAGYAVCPINFENFSFFLLEVD